MEAEPTNLYADGVAPIYRSNPDEVFYIRMQASPQLGSDDFGYAGGATVNCYVDADDLRTAEIQATLLIQQNGWQPQRFEAWELICAERANDVSTEDDGLSARELVEQAKIDGEVCVFFCWPIDASDVDDSSA